MINQNSIKTHCLVGHEYDLTNTYLSPKRQRICRTCEKDRKINKKNDGFCNHSGCWEKIDFNGISKYYCEVHRLMNKERKKKYFKDNKLLYKERYGPGSKIRTQVIWETLRNDFFSIYGQECVCCSERNKAFLTLDHIHGGGRKERRELKLDAAGIYKRAIKEFRSDLYQVLCYNCNCAKRTKTNCPHQINFEVVAIQGEGK